MSGQLNLPTALSQEKNPRHPLNRRLSKSQSNSGRFGEENPTPNRSANSLVTTQSAPPRLPKIKQRIAIKKRVKMQNKFLNLLQYSNTITLKSWNLRMGLTGCPETSVVNYHCSLLNNSEQLSSQHQDQLPDAENTKQVKEW